MCMYMYVLCCVLEVFSRYVLALPKVSSSARILCRMLKGWKIKHGHKVTDHVHARFSIQINRKLVVNRKLLVIYVYRDRFNLYSGLYRRLERVETT
jgi:hypothetical protein